jgi:hypothetical protein
MGVTMRFQSDVICCGSILPRAIGLKDKAGHNDGSRFDLFIFAARIQKSWAVRMRSRFALKCAGNNRNEDACALTW